MTKNIIAAVAALDLREVRTRVYLDTKWPSSRLDAAERDYRDFLSQEIVREPTPDVDKFWHHHILDTKKYAQDCNNMFGYFLHHQPSRAAENTCTKVTTCTKVRATCTKQSDRATCTKIAGRPLGDPLDIEAAYM